MPDILFFSGLYTREKYPENRQVLLWIADKVFNEKKVVEFYKSIYSNFSDDEKKIINDSFKNRYKKNLMIER